MHNASIRGALLFTDWPPEVTSGEGSFLNCLARSSIILQPSYIVNLYRFGADSNEHFQGLVSPNYTRILDMRIMWASFAQGRADNVSVMDATNAVSKSPLKQGTA